MKKLTFALYYGNRGFFPGEIIEEARAEMRAAVEKAGHGFIEMDASLTRFGAVETMEEGKVYAEFLKKNEGKYDGVILCLPNFGDENGASVALRDAGVPILLQAYPDEIGKMDFAHRRDAFCGKLSIADVFRQMNIRFTVFEPHVVHPASETFQHNLRKFAQVCNIVKKMRRFNIGALGARTTVFKTIRYDEIALADNNINCETLDFLQVIARIKAQDKTSAAFKAAKQKMADAADNSKMPDERQDTQAALYLTLKDIAAEYCLDAIALRCWSELQQEFRITPCSVMGVLAEEGLPVSCELDVCNAIAMAALQAAADEPAICLDWNNNYGDDPDKCILFHCGQVAPCCMDGKGTVISHKMFDKGCEELGGVGWGCNQGRIKAAPMTYLSAKTEWGKLYFYVGEGKMTADPIEDGFFGVAGVCEIEGLQPLMKGISLTGFRHHVAIGMEHVEDAIREAFETYLGYEFVEVKEYA